jgi:hypothetical protein
MIAAPRLRAGVFRLSAGGDIFVVKLIYPRCPLFANAGRPMTDRKRHKLPFLSFFAASAHQNN